MHGRWRGFPPRTLATLQATAEYGQNAVGTLGKVVTAADGVLEWQVG